VSNSLRDFQRTGGMKKFNEVAKGDIRTATKLVREYITYDLFRSAKKTINDGVKKFKDGR
jgi:hypothetical protein